MSVVHVIDLGVSAHKVYRSLKKTPGGLVFDGYDDDPRDLWAVPEVQHWCRAFCRISERRGWPIEPMYDLGWGAFFIMAAANERPGSRFAMTAAGRSVYPFIAGRNLGLAPTWRDVETHRAGSGQ